MKSFRTKVLAPRTRNFSRFTLSAGAPTRSEISDALRSDSSIFERIVRQADGRLFLVRFVIVERGGVLRGRIISCALITEEAKAICGRAVLGAPIATSSEFLPILSPFFSCFDFLTSVQIRAPSRR